MRKKINILIKVLLLFVVLGIFILTYVPFCKLKDIYDDNWLPEYTNTEKEDQLIYRIIGNSVIFCERLSMYCRCLFITKGKTFENIRCNDDNDNIHNVSLKFNWDNSITVHDSDKTYSIEVDSILIHNRMYKCSSAEEGGMAYTSWETTGHKVIIDSMWIAYNPKEENYFVRIDFYDKKGNRITVKKQQSSLPHGRQRYAFDFSINGTELWTGKETGFDY